MAESTSRPLAEDYEVLRREVVEPVHTGGSMQGRALLMFKGMANWMKCGAPPPSTHSAPSATTQSALKLPAGIEQNLISLVATMTLINVREGITC